jgi:hypothetical protein
MTTYQMNLISAGFISLDSTFKGYFSDPDQLLSGPDFSQKYRFILATFVKSWIPYLIKNISVI